MTLVVLTEEESMEVVLRQLLPRMGLIEGSFQIVTFDGVRDLEQSLVRRVKAWRDPNARFLIIRDNDSGDCQQRKRRLLALLEQTNRAGHAKIRIVMQQLEAWFLGDKNALISAGLIGGARIPSTVRGDPSRHRVPADVIRHLKRDYGKVTGARLVAPYLSLEPGVNTASCFHTTLQAIRSLTAIVGDTP